MKKLISLFIVVVMLLCLAACGQAAAPAEEKTEEPAAAAPVEEKTEEPAAEEPAAEEPAEPQAAPKTYDELLAAAKAAGKDYTIGYLTYSLSIQWAQDMDTAFKELADEWGFNYIMSDPQGDVETQVNQLQVMLDQGVDAIVTLIVDEGMAEAMVSMCKEYNVPLIGESKLLHDEDFNIISPSVELSAQMCGSMCSQWIFDNYEAKGLGDMDNDWSKVAYITCTKSTTENQNLRCAGAWDKWKELVPEFPDENHFTSDVVSDTSDDFVAATYNQISSLIAGHTEIEYWLVCATQEQYGQGAARAIDDNGLKDKTIITSIGGELATGEWDTGLDTCWYAASYFEAMDCASLCIQGIYDYLINGIDCTEMFPEWKAEGAEYAAAKFAGVMVTAENYKEYMG